MLLDGLLKWEQEKMWRENNHEKKLNNVNNKLEQNRKKRGWRSSKKPVDVFIKWARRIFCRRIEYTLYMYYDLFFLLY